MSLGFFVRKSYVRSPSKTGPYETKWSFFAFHGDSLLTFSKIFNFPCVENTWNEKKAFYCLKICIVTKAVLTNDIVSLKEGESGHLCNHLHYDHENMF